MPPPAKLLNEAFLVFWWEAKVLMNFRDHFLYLRVCPVAVPCQYLPPGLPSASVNILPNFSYQVPVSLSSTAKTLPGLATKMQVYHICGNNNPLLLATEASTDGSTSDFRHTRWSGRSFCCLKWTTTFPISCILL